MAPRFRFVRGKDGKKHRRPVCDFMESDPELRCNNLAYREVDYYNGEECHWCYLCRKHFEEAKAKKRPLIGWYPIDWMKR